MYYKGLRRDRGKFTQQVIKNNKHKIQIISNIIIILSKS